MWDCEGVLMYESFQWFKEPIDYVPYIESEIALMRKFDLNQKSPYI